MSELTLIGLPQSNFVWAVRIAAAEKGLPLTLVPAAPQAPEAVAAHPLGKIPALRHGAVTIAESRAICLYLERLAPEAPRAPADAALVEQWVSLIVTDVEPIAIRELLFAYMFPDTPDGAPDRARIEAATPKLAIRLDVLTRQLGDGPWLTGADFTLADAYLAPVLAYLAQTPEGAEALAARPALDAYRARLLARPSVAATTPPAP